MKINNPVPDETGQTVIAVSQTDFRQLKQTYDAMEKVAEAVFRNSNWKFIFNR